MKEDQNQRIADWKQAGGSHPSRQCFGINPRIKTRLINKMAMVTVPPDKVCGFNWFNYPMNHEGTSGTTLTETPSKRTLTISSLYE